MFIYVMYLKLSKLSDTRPPFFRRIALSSHTRCCGLGQSAADQGNISVVQYNNMGDPPVSLDRKAPASRPIPATTSPTASTSSSASSSFPSLKPSSVSRKKPAGLSITKSVRAAPPLPLSDQGTPGASGTKDGLAGWTSEADRLRQDIERLQLEAGRDYDDDPGTGGDSNPPLTPGHAQSDSSVGSSSRKKTGKKKKADKEDTVKDEDLDIISDLGAGNGGTVTKVWNKKRNCVMARKVGPSPSPPRSCRTGRSDSA